MGDRGPEAEALWAEAAVNKLMPPLGGYMHKIERAGFDLPSFLALILPMSELPD